MDRFQRVVYLVVAVLAAIAGIILVAAPGSTQRLFAWGLKPPAVAGMTGGMFVGAAVAYGVAATRTRVAGFGLSLFSIVFAGPVFGYTLLHHDLFDFGRWQAVLWLASFTLIIVLSLVMLAGGVWRSTGRGPFLPAWARVVLGVMGLGAVAIATAMWFKSEGPKAWIPLDLSQFAGQLFGMWFCLTGFACLWSSIRPAEEARVLVVAATALLAGAVVGTIRAYSGFVHANRAVFLVGLLVALGLCVAILAAGSPARDGGASP
jgi:hypothetical protein